MEYLKKFYKYRNLLSELVKRDIKIKWMNLKVEELHWY